jgi:DNA/RNA-binding domain of Phe-tRNA-synthetase-like protein
MQRAVEVSIAGEVRERFPEVNVGGFVVVGLQALQPGSWARPDALDVGVDHDNVQGWRRAIGACGLKPSRYKSSVEQLVRRYGKGEVIESGITAVDLYCDVSARNVSPFGGYDLDRLPEPRVEMRTPRPGDAFHAIGGRGDEFPLFDDVVVYACGNTVMCWAWNHRDSAETGLEADTTAALFLGEAAYGEQHAALQSAVADLAESLRAAGVVVGAPGFADADAPTLQLEC